MKTNKTKPRGKVLIIGPVNPGEMQEDNAKFQHIAGMLTALGFEVVNFKSNVFSNKYSKCDMAVLLNNWETDKYARNELKCILDYNVKIIQETAICHL